MGRISDGNVNTSTNSSSGRISRMYGSDYNHAAEYNKKVITRDTINQLNSMKEGKDTLDFSARFNLVSKAKDLGILDKSNINDWINLAAARNEQEIKKQQFQPFKVGPINIPYQVVDIAATPYRVPGAIGNFAKSAFIDPMVSGINYLGKEYIPTVVEGISEKINPKGGQTQRLKDDASYWQNQLVKLGSQYDTLERTGASQAEKDKLKQIIDSNYKNLIRSNNELTQREKDKLATLDPLKVLGNVVNAFNIPLAIATGGASFAVKSAAAVGPLAKIVGANPKKAVDIAQKLFTSKAGKWAGAAGGAGTYSVGNVLAEKGSQATPGEVGLSFGTGAALGLGLRAGAVGLSKGIGKVRDIKAGRAASQLEKQIIDEQAKQAAQEEINRLEGQTMAQPSMTAPEAPQATREANIGVSSQQVITPPETPVVSPQPKVKPEKPFVRESEVPVITSFGRKIELSPENGWSSLKTADGGIIYRKVNQVGSNRKGDKEFINLWYGADGTKLTQEQAKAMIDGTLESLAPKTKVTPQKTKPEPTITSVSDAIAAETPTTKVEVVSEPPVKPAFIKEGMGVKHNLDTGEWYLIDTKKDNKEIRFLTAAEIKQQQQYQKDIAAYSKFKENEGKLTAAQKRKQAQTEEINQKPLNVATKGLDKEDLSMIFFKRFPELKNTYDPNNQYNILKRGEEDVVGVRLTKPDGTTKDFYYEGMAPKETTPVKEKPITSVSEAIAAEEAKSSKTKPSVKEPASTTKKIEKSQSKLEQQILDNRIEQATQKPAEGTYKIAKGDMTKVANEIAAGIRDRLPEGVPEHNMFISYEGQAKQMIERYTKNWYENRAHALNVLQGRVAPENNVERIAYQMIMDGESLSKGSASEWYQMNNAYNINAKSAYPEVSQAAQKLSFTSLLSQKYDINNIINTLEAKLIQDRSLFFKKQNTTFGKQVKDYRNTIQKSIPEITRENLATFLNSYDQKRVGPLLQAFTRGEFKIQDLVNATPAMRIDIIKKFVGEDDALKIASDFERKLLLVNQKKGLMTWLRTAPGIDATTRKDIVDDVKNLQNVLDPINAGGFDNIINQALGVRLTKTEQIELFNIVSDLKKREDAVIAKYGSQENQLKESQGRNYKPSQELYNLGTAKTKLQVFLGDAANNRKGTYPERLSNYFNETDPTKIVVDVIFKTNGLLKALKASFDNSVGGRQLLPVAMTNPRQWFKAYLKSWEYLGRGIKDGKKAEFAFRTLILSDPWSEVAAKHGLRILKNDDVYNNVGLGNLFKGKVNPYKASELAYDAGAQVARLELFKKLYSAEMARIEKYNTKQMAKYSDGGKRLEMAPNYGENLAKLINSLTGAASFDKKGGDVIAKYGNLAFFSARFLKSQVDKLVLHPVGFGIGGPIYKTVDGNWKWNPVQKLALKNLVKMASTVYTTMAIASAMNKDSVEWDPRSSDFGKIKVGNTRFDLTGGMGQFIVLGARLFPLIYGQNPQTKNSNTKLISELNTGEYGSKTGLQIAQDFFSNKASPLTGLTMDSLRGTDVNRVKSTPAEKLSDLFVPMSISNAKEVIYDPNAANWFWASLFDFNGISTNTYAGAGMGSKGVSWDTSTSAAVNAFKEKVGKDTFKAAGKEADDKFNSMMLKMIETDKYKNMSSEEKKSIIRKSKDMIQKDIFEKYNFEYKQDRKSQSQRQSEINFINENL